MSAGAVGNVVAVTGDLTIASNYVQVEDMSERVIGGYGRFNTNITMSYSGSALIAQLLEESAGNTFNEKGEVVANPSPPYTVKFDGLNAPGSPPRLLNLLEAVQAFPVFTYVFRAFPKTAKKGLDADTWRIHDSLGANRPGFDLMTKFLLAKREEPGKPQFLNPDSLSVDFSKTRCIIINDANLGYRNRDWEWIKRLSEPASAKTFVVLKVRERKPLPATALNKVVGLKLDDDTTLTEPSLQGSFTSESLLARLSQTCLDRLIVVLPVHDLRRSGAAVSTRVSWERTVQDIVETSNRFLDGKTNNKPDPFGGARFVIVTLGPDGAVLLFRHKDKRKAALCFANATIEGAVAQSKPGGMRGYDTCVASAVTHYLATIPVAVEEESLFSALKRAVLAGVAAARTLHDAGLQKECEANEISSRYAHLGVVTAENFYEADEDAGSSKKHPVFFPFKKVGAAIRDGVNRLDLVPNPNAPADTTAPDENAWKGLRIINIGCKFPRPKNPKVSYFEATWWSFTSRYLLQRTEAIQNAKDIADPLYELKQKIEKLIDDYVDKPEARADRTEEAIRWIAAETMARKVLRQGVGAFRSDPASFLHSEQHRGNSHIALNEDEAPSRVPYGKFGDLETVDRREIESLRNLSELFQQYCQSSSDKRSRPLSVGVFGRPGGGKSFAVKNIFKSLDIPYEELTFNVAQFEHPEQVLQALHQVRDISLKGKIPLVFWDEFDSTLNTVPFGWLQYFLAPMQDGQFQHGPRSHQTGRAIFVFAGSRFSSVEQITQEIPPPAHGPHGPQVENPLQTLQQEWEKAKGKDFQSRLEGNLNIQGPEKPEEVNGLGSGSDDYIYLIRRALVVRGQLLNYFPSLFGYRQTLRIDDDVSVRLLLAGIRHGARSLEKILLESTLDGKTRFDVSCLPADSQLGLHSYATDFEDGLRSELTKDSIPDTEADDYAHKLHLLLSYQMAEEGWS